MDCFDFFVGKTPFRSAYTLPEYVAREWALDMVVKQGVVVNSKWKRRVEVVDSAGESYEILLVGEEDGDILWEEGSWNFL